VVSSVLFDLTPASDDIVSIVGRAGLTVDWNLNSRENYSHSTRKRAYRPRVHAAYSALNPEDREAALSLIMGELAHRFPRHAVAIKTNLARIGWTLKSVVEPGPRTDQPPLIMKRIKELQRLLLLQVRDQQEPPELSRYSEQDQVYNSALLVEDGYVDGEAIRGASGEYASVVMLHLTSKGHDYLEQAARPQEDVTTEGSASREGQKLIFVSHSSADKDLAEELVDLLCSALRLGRSDFMCTSVDGSKLRGGDDTDDVLRKDIREVPAFLSLLTRRAIASTYVLFELGARWGFGTHHIPLLAKGAGTEVLKEPLKGKNALQLSNEADVHQLVEDMGRILRRKPEPVQSYLKRIRNIVEISQAGAGSVDALAARLTVAAESDPSLAIEVVAKKRLIECARILSDARGMDAALLKLAQLQRTLNSEKEQITVIVNERIAMHTDPNLENRLVAETEGWKDTTGRSLYSGMKALRSGTTITRILGYANRVTAMAFELFDNPACMILVEVHYRQ
jgi:hypothetical protein